MIFDWTVNLGNLVTLVTMCGAGIGFVYTMISRIDAIASRLFVLENEFKKLIDVLIQQGRQEERMTALDARLVNQGLRLDDLIRRFNDKFDKKNAA